MTTLFPSPIGELHFSIGVTIIEKKEVVYCFRPLSGSYISQYGDTTVWDNYTYVSVPYRGATFLNDMSNAHVGRIS